MSASDRLQDGIYFHSKEQAAPCFRLLLLNARNGATSDVIGQALAAVMTMLAGLGQGHVPERTDQSTAETRATAGMFERLRVMLAFGRRLFDNQLHDPPLVEVARPEYLVYLRGGEDPFPTLPWAEPGKQPNLGEADIALQLTADNEAAVNCAAVEVWKLLIDHHLPLEPSASFGGFQRSDGRGWLEFHDGVSNIRSSERLEALEAPGDPAWMDGGTYMSFLRFTVDLAAWRRLSRPEQELLIGRDKLGGRPLVALERKGDTVVGVPSTVGEDDETDFCDPPQTSDPLLEASHLHRANQNRASPSAPAGLRVFRQGYDFLETIGPAGPRLGLNFVSFQRDLGVLQHLLHLPGWLGDVNFGGPAQPKHGEPPALELIRLQAGGLYAVPPRADPLPGAPLFESVRPG